ncbi:hypothetical protein ACOME3_007682 [Neoechinorhynchus agilis]
MHIMKIRKKPQSRMCVTHTHRIMADPFDDEFRQDFYRSKFPTILNRTVEEEDDDIKECWDDEDIDDVAKPPSVQPSQPKKGEVASKQESIDKHEDARNELRQDYEKFMQAHVMFSDRKSLEIDDLKNGRLLGTALSILSKSPYFSRLFERTLHSGCDLLSREEDVKALMHAMAELTKRKKAEEKERPKGVRKDVEVSANADVFGLDRLEQNVDENDIDGDFM